MWPFKKKPTNDLLMERDPFPVSEHSDSTPNADPFSATSTEASNSFNTGLPQTGLEHQDVGVPGSQFGSFPSQNSNSGFPSQQDSFSASSSSNFGSPALNKSAMSPVANSEQYTVSKRDIELILAKLETIKTQLENVDHRLSNLEREKHSFYR